MTRPENAAEAGANLSVPASAGSTAPVLLLGECTVCARRVYSRSDRPEPEWVRLAGGVLRPHRHRDFIGTCSLCGYRVFVDGEGVEKVLVAKRPRPHQHKQPFEVVGEPAYRIVPVHDVALAGAL